MEVRVKINIAIIVSLLSLIACSEQQVNTTYLCGKKKLTLSIINDKYAELTFNNETHLINHEKSASGNKYISENVLFWGKDNHAMLIISGKKQQCIIN